MHADAPKIKYIITILNKEQIINKLIRTKYEFLKLFFKLF